MSVLCYLNFSLHCILCPRTIARRSFTFYRHFSLYLSLSLSSLKGSLEIFFDDNENNEAEAWIVMKADNRIEEKGDYIINSIKSLLSSTFSFLFQSSLQQILDLTDILPPRLHFIPRNDSWPKKSGLKRPSFPQDSNLFVKDSIFPSPPI